MTGPENLSTRQQSALRALLSHPTIAAAATACGLTERTLYRYLEDSEFVAEYRRRRAHLLDESVGEMLAAGVKAVRTLESGMEATDPEGSILHHVRIRAASQLLVLLFRGVEIADFEQRIAEIERKLDDPAQ